MQLSSLYILSGFFTRLPATEHGMELPCPMIQNPALAFIKSHTNREYLDTRLASKNIIYTNIANMYSPMVFCVGE